MFGGIASYRARRRPKLLLFLSKNAKKVANMEKKTYLCREKNIGVL